MLWESAIKFKLGTKLRLGLAWGMARLMTEVLLRIEFQSIAQCRHLNQF